MSRSKKTKGAFAAPATKLTETESSIESTEVEEAEEESKVETETEDQDSEDSDTEQPPDTQRLPSAPPPAGSQPPPPPPKPPSVPPPPPEPAPKKVRDLGGEYECLCRVNFGETTKFPGEKLTLTNEQARHYLKLNAVKPLD